jgi:cytochrome c oxidase subunit 2
LPLPARIPPDRIHEPDRTREGRGRTARLIVVAVAAAVTLCGCSGRQSMFNSPSRQSHAIDVLWWWMLAAAAVVFFGAVALLVAAWFKRETPGLPLLGEREGVTELMVLCFGIAIPVVALVALFAVSDIYLIGQTSPPDPKTTSMTVDVIGHQWWWEVKYPGTDVVTANEIHIPVDTRVNVVVTTNDVIHSLWVPALQRKIDTIPGYHNRILFDARRIGVYRGQCSQYCGFEHADMALRVFVQRRSAYRSWLAAQEKPAPRTTPAARGAAGVSAARSAGEHVFMTSQCSSCHTIAGTSAHGAIGPNLTHLASRTSLASDTLANTPKNLAAWIRDPQAIKPGAQMPDLGLGRTQVRELVSYLDSLR